MLARTALGAALGVLVVCPAAFGADLSFEGTFASDDQVRLIDFTLSSTRTVTFQSWGYGGGVNAAGTTIAAGGFATYFTWYAADGTQIGTADGGCGAGNMNSATSACLDAYASVLLPAGAYILAITESGNDAAGNLSDGFTEQGLGNFTATTGCPLFCDYAGGTGDGHWAVDLLNVDSASEPTATPEPATLTLVIGGLAIAALARRSQSSAR